MAVTIKVGDLMFLADEDNKFMKEIEVGSFVGTAADAAIDEIDLQRITNTDIEEILT